MANQRIVQVSTPPLVAKKDTGRQTQDVQAVVRLFVRYPHALGMNSHVDPRSVSGMPGQGPLRRRTPSVVFSSLDTTLVTPFRS